MADRGYSILLENNYDRKDEMEADKLGVTLASGVGYAPSGLSAFLTRLADRNKDLKEPSGIFASHPETQARLDALAKLIKDNKLDGTAMVAARFGQSITYKPVPVTAVPQGSTVSAAPAPAAAKPAASGGSGKLGLGGLSALGGEKSSSQTVSSAGSRRRPPAAASRT